MMSENMEQIHAITFDIANTLDRRETNESLQLSATETIISLCTVNGITIAWNCQELHNLLRRRFRQMYCWSLVSLKEPSPVEVWTKWLLPDLPAEYVAPLAERLTSIWMGQFYCRRLKPEAGDVLRDLKRRGYKIGCISNTLSASFTMASLRRYGIISYFDTIVLSSSLGFRKPHPMLFSRALEGIGIEPHQAAHVGEAIVKDVAGAVNAGYGVAILLANEGWTKRDKLSARVEPDIVIHSLTDLLAVFQTG